MKGLLQNRRSWIRMEDSTVLDRNKLDSHLVEVDGKQVPFKDLEDKPKKEVTSAMELEINTLYRALNGEVRPNTRIGEYIRNTLNAGTFSSIFSPALELFIVDYIRPRLLASNYLAVTIPVGPSLNRSILAMVRAFGLVKVKEVGKNSPLPIVSPNLGEYTDQIAYDIKKYGVKLEIDKDLQNSDEFGVLGFLLTSIADAFRYRKEVEVMKVINNVGEVMFDNATPAAGTFKTTTSGRGIGGGFNGTVALEDITKVFSYAANRGMTPTTIVVHPYVLFNMVGDNELSKLLGVSELSDNVRRTAFEPGWGHPFGEDMGYALRRYGADGIGGPASDVRDWGKIGMGPLGTLGVDPFSTGIAGSNSYFLGKANIPGANVTVVALPQVPITTVTTPGNKFVTNIYIVSDKKPVGILQEHEPAALEWEDIEKEISYLGFREKYATTPLFQGRGVYTLKNVVVDRNYSFQQSVTIEGPLEEPGTTAVVTA